MAPGAAFGHGCHCGKSLSFKSFKIHERLYYNPVDAVWIKSGTFVSSHEDTEISSSDSEPSSVELYDLLEQNASTASPDSFEDTSGAMSDSDNESEPSSLDRCGECEH